MKSFALVFTFLLFSFTSVSQEEEILHKPWGIGISIGVNHTNIIAPQSVIEIGEVDNQLGFQLGFVADYQLGKMFSIAPKIELSFNEGEIVLADIEGNESRYDVLPITMNLMTHFTIKKPEGKVKPYFFAGPNLKVPISKRPKVSTSFYHSYDFAIDFGIGVEKSYSKFNFSPELRYSYGLLNVNQNPRFQSMNFHQVSLVFSLVGV